MRQCCEVSKFPAAFDSRQTLAVSRDGAIHSWHELFLSGAQETEFSTLGGLVCHPVDLLWFSLMPAELLTSARGSWT